MSVKSSRREFFKKSGIIAAGSVAALSGQKIAGKGSKLYAQSASDGQTDSRPMNNNVYLRRLGKTGLYISDVAFGVMQIGTNQEWLIEKAIDEGINYFDTAPDYQNGNTERVLGRAIKGNRQDIVIASKLCNEGTGMAHLAANTPTATVIQKVEDSLSRLDTDYLDIVQIHALGEPVANSFNGENFHYNRIHDEEMWNAIIRLKEQGKIRFVGVSAHGNHSFPQSVIDSIDTGYFDMILLKYHYQQSPDVTDVIQHAADNDIGIVVMKTTRYGGMGSIAANIRWALQNPGVASVAKSIRSESDLNQCLEATGTQYSMLDEQEIEQNFYRHYSRLCRVGCTECESACPHQVPIGTILRYSMYFNEYPGLKKEAKDCYAQLYRDKNAHRCSDCSGPCTSSCPFGVNTKQQLSQAHNLLSWRK